MVIALKNDGIKSVVPVTDEQIKQTEKQVEKIISSLPFNSYGGSNETKMSE